MKPRKFTVREHERYDEPVFSIVRLAGTGAGAAALGDVAALHHGSTVVDPAVEIIRVEERRLKSLGAADAELLLRPPANTLAELHRILEGLYKFRPRWDWDDTLLTVLTVRRSRFE